MNANVRRAVTAAVALCGLVSGASVLAAGRAEALPSHAPWQITNHGSLRCLEAGGPAPAVRVTDCSGMIEQYWTGPLQTAGATYRDWSSRRCLTGDASGVVSLATCGAGLAQTWSRAADGTLRNALTGGCLDGDTFSGTLTTKPCTGGPYQIWDFYTQAG